jgi:hypothetical protein
MKKHIYFNLPDKPENMGQSQLLDPSDLQSFISERSEILKDAKIEGNKLLFTKSDGTQGYATITEVQDDFQN